MSAHGTVAGMTSTPPASPRWFGVGAIAVSLGFAAFTLHAWEDYFITFRASLNLATGNGLVFQPGERVHTFTSPLGTLLPALFAIGGGENAAVRALWKQHQSGRDRPDLLWHLLMFQAWHERWRTAREEPAPALRAVGVT